MRRFTAEAFSFTNVTGRELLAFVFVFAAYFITAKVGQIIFFDFNTSPAVIWPPTGIALAAVILGGYRMWVPIILAQFAASASYFGIVPIVFITTVAYTLQPLIGLYLLRQFNFQPSLDTFRNIFLLVLASFVVTAIGPSITTAAQILMGTLVSGPALVWTRAWAGGAFSVLIITTLAISWYPFTTIILRQAQKWELAAAFALLGAVDILLFWTTYLQNLGIAIIFILPAVLMWLALRFHPRWLTLAIFISAVFGIAGTIIAHPTSVPVNAQLLSVEVYLGLIAAIFLIFAGVVEERRVAFQRLKDSNVELEFALQKISADDKAKNEFIAILAHELRNPLAPIVSALEWLKLQPQSAEAQTAIESAEEHTTMMRRLLDDLLDTARVTQKKFKLQKEMLLLQDVISQSVESTAGFLQSRRHSLRTSMPKEPVLIFADPVHLKQVFINILNNAGKYTEPGGTIHVSCEVRDTTVLVTVRDSGMGIARKHLPHIFHPFRRLGPAMQVGTGLGIGLSLTKRLVEMHGGTIQAESEGEGAGSTFTISLPRPAQMPMPAMPPQETRGGKTVRSRILIVDDNAAAAYGLQKLLTHHGHEVRTILTGTEALTAVPLYRPDVVLLDIGLPDKNGYEVARQLRSSGWDHPIIALTGYGQDTDKLEAKNAGIDHHLVKPVSVTDVIVIISRIQASSMQNDVNA